MLPKLCNIEKYFEQARSLNKKSKQSIDSVVDFEDGNIIDLSLL